MGIKGLDVPYKKGLDVFIAMHETS